MTQSAAARPVATNAIPERRAHERQTMVLRVGILGRDGRASFCLVKNISPEGLQVKLFGQLAPGAAVQVRIGDEVSLSGRAIWVRDQRAGIAFEQPLDPATLLRVTQRLAATRRRSTPRMDASARAILRTGGKTYAAELRDISTSGAKLRTSKTLTPGPSIMLTLPDLPSLKAYPRWIDGQDLGLVFETPIPIQILATWLDDRVTVSG